MTDEQLAELVRQAWGGEVLGVALFDRLAEREGDPARQAVLQRARDHEAATLEHARRLADDLGVELGGGEVEQETGRRVAEVLADMPWEQRVTTICEGTERYRELYAALSDVCDHPAVAALVAHEPALHDLLGT
jgi:hypothetical protein